MKTILATAVFLIITTGLGSCNKDKDTVKPWIKINGYNPVYTELGKPYEDAGAVVWDINAVGDTVNISGNLQVTNNVNTSTVGKYQVIYNASDDAGNRADEVTRTVYVQVFK